MNKQRNLRSYWERLNDFYSICRFTEKWLPQLHRIVHIFEKSIESERSEEITTDYYSFYLHFQGEAT